MPASDVACCFSMLSRVSVRTSVKRVPAEFTCTILLHTFTSSRVGHGHCVRSALSRWPVASSNTCAKERRAGLRSRDQGTRETRCQRASLVQRATATKNSRRFSRPVPSRQSKRWPMRKCHCSLRATSSIYRRVRPWNTLSISPNTSPTPLCCFRFGAVLTSR